MKMNRIAITLLLVLAALTLTACSGAGVSQSYSGTLLTEEYVYFAGGGKVYALRAENGNEIWSYPDKPNNTRLFYAEPVLAGDQLIVVDYDKKLTSLDPNSGDEKWQFDGAKNKYIDSPLVINDLIIAPNTDYSMYALDFSGNLVWKYETEQALWTRPASDGTNVYFPSMDQNLYALDLATGALKWKTSLDTSSVARPIVDNGVIYLGTLGGKMLAINTKDGSRIWEQEVGGGVWAAPVLHEGNLYVGDQTGQINILSAVDGKSISYIPTKNNEKNDKAAILGTGLVLEEGIAFGNEQGQFTVIGFDGKQQWLRSFEGSLYSNMQINGERIIIPITNGKEPLVSMSIDGKDNWYFSEKK